MAEGDAGNSSSSLLPTYTSMQQQFNENLLKILIALQNKTISNQLDESNFLLWKFQIITAVRGYGLEDYLLGTKVMPDQFSTDNEGKSITNREFIIYNRQDNLLSSWLLFSISSSLLHKYLVLNQLLELRSTKSNCEMLKKGTMSMREYLTKVKSLCVQLVAAGHTVSDT